MRLIDADALEQSLTEKGDDYKVSMFATSNDCNIARLVAFECAEEVKNAPTIEAIPIDVVAEMLVELFGDECCCNYNDIDEWLPMLCEHSETCPEPIEKNGCWKQFIKHWRNNA